MTFDQTDENYVTLWSVS